MARDGDWLTPRFMGRLRFYKPPLLIWGAALSTKILGVDSLSGYPARYSPRALTDLSLGRRTRRLAGGRSPPRRASITLWLAFHAVYDRRIPGFVHVRPPLRTLLRPMAWNRARTWDSPLRWRPRSSPKDRGHTAARCARNLLDRGAAQRTPNVLARRSGCRTCLRARIAVVRVSIDRPLPLVLGGTHRRGDPRLRRRRATANLSRKPGDFLFHAACRHRPAAASHRLLRDPCLPHRPAAAYRRVHIGGRVDGGVGGRHAYLAIPQCRVSSAAGPCARGVYGRLESLRHV